MQERRTCWSDVMKTPAAQQVLLDMARQPRDRAFVSTAPEGSGVRVEDCSPCASSAWIRVLIELREKGPREMLRGSNNAAPHKATSSARCW